MHLMLAEFKWGGLVGMCSLYDITIDTRDTPYNIMIVLKENLNDHTPPRSVTHPYTYY